MKTKYLILFSFILILSSCSNQKQDIDGVANKNTNINLSQSGNNNKTDKKESKLISSETQDIINLQMKNGPDYILKLDCNKYSNNIEAKKYCESQKKIYEERSSEITWEKILKKGNDYIKTFDCKKINQEVGKKYCEEYKKLLNNQKNTTITQTGAPIKLGDEKYNTGSLKKN